MILRIIGLTAFVHLAHSSGCHFLFTLFHVTYWLWLTRFH